MPSPQLPHRGRGSRLRSDVITIGVHLRFLMLASDALGQQALTREVLSHVMDTKVATSARAARGDQGAARDDTLTTLELDVVKILAGTDKVPALTGRRIAMHLNDRLLEARDKEAFVSPKQPPAGWGVAEGLKTLIVRSIGRYRLHEPGRAPRPDDPLRPDVRGSVRLCAELADRVLVAREANLPTGKDKAFERLRDETVRSVHRTLKELDSSNEVGSSAWKKAAVEAQLSVLQLVDDPTMRSVLGPEATKTLSTFARDRLAEQTREARSGDGRRLSGRTMRTTGSVSFGTAATVTAAPRTSTPGGMPAGAIVFPIASKGTGGRHARPRGDLGLG